MDVTKNKMFGNLNFKRLLGILMSLCMVIGMIGTAPVKEVKADDSYGNTFHFMTKSEAYLTRNGNIVTVTLQSFKEDVLYSENDNGIISKPFTSKDAGTITITLPDENYEIYSDGTPIAIEGDVNKWVRDSVNYPDDWHYDFDIMTNAPSFTYSLSAEAGYTLSSDSYYDTANNIDDDGKNDTHFGVIMTGTESTSATRTVGTETEEKRISVWTDVNKNLKWVDMYSDGLISLVLNNDGTLTGTYNYVNEHGHEDEDGDWVDPDVSSDKAGTVTVSVPDGYTIESYKSCHRSEERIKTDKDGNDIIGTDGKPVTYTHEWDERGFYTDAPEATFTYKPENGYRVEGDYRYDQGQNEPPHGSDKDFKSNASITETVDLSRLPYHFEQDKCIVHVSADFKEWAGMATIVIDREDATLDGNSIIINKIKDARTPDQINDDEWNNRDVLSKIKLTVKERVKDPNTGKVIAPVETTDAYTYTFEIDDLPDNYYFELEPDAKESDISAKLTNLTNDSLSQYVDVWWEHDDDGNRKNACLSFNYNRDSKWLTNNGEYELTFDNSNYCELRQESETVTVWLNKDGWDVSETTNSATYNYSYLLTDRYTLISEEDLPKYTITIEGASIEQEYEWIDDKDEKGDPIRKKEYKKDGNYLFEFDRNNAANVKIKLSGDFTDHMVPLGIDRSQWESELKVVDGAALLTGFDTPLPESVNLNIWCHDPFEEVFETQQYDFNGLNISSGTLKQNGNTFTVDFIGYDIENDDEEASLDPDVKAGTLTITFPSDSLILGYSVTDDENNWDKAWRDGVTFFTTADYVDVIYTPANGYTAESRWRWECDDVNHNFTENEKIPWNDQFTYHGNYDYSAEKTTWRVYGVTEGSFDCDDNPRTVIDTEFRMKARSIEVYHLDIDDPDLDYSVLTDLRQSGNSVIATFCHSGYGDDGWYKTDDIVAGTVTYTVPEGSKIIRIVKDHLDQILDENDEPIEQWRSSYFWTDADSISIKVEPTAGHKIYSWGHDLTVVDPETKDEERFGEGKSYKTRTAVVSLENIKYGDGRRVWTDFAEYLGTMTINIDGRYATYDGKTFTHYVNNTGNSVKFSVTQNIWENDGHVWYPYDPEIIDADGYKNYRYTFDVDERWGKNFTVENVDSLGLSSRDDLTVWYGSYQTKLIDDDSMPDAYNVIDFSFIEENYRDGLMSGNMDYTLAFSVPAPVVYDEPEQTEPQSATPPPTPTPETIATVEPKEPEPEPTDQTQEISNIGGTVTTTTTTEHADGSKTTVEEVVAPDGSSSTTTTTENADGSTTTVSETVAADGSSSTTKSTTIQNEDGSVETVSETVNSDGTSSTTTTTVTEEDDGSVKTVSETVNSDGTSSTTTATTTEDKKGNKTTESLTENSDGTTVEETKVENKDGSSSTSSVTKDEDGEVLTKTTEDVSVADNGDVTIETKTENKDGSSLESTVLISTEGQVVSQTLETDAKGKVDITFETDNTDGSSVVQTFTTSKSGAGKIKVTNFEVDGKKASIPEKIVVGDKEFDVVTIAKNALAGNTVITNVEIPDTVTYIGKNAFAGATKLKSVTLPDAVTYIGKNAFQGASKLKTINLGSDIQKIKKNAFEGISSKATIYIDAKDEADYERIVALLKKSGLPEGVKVKKAK